MVSTQRDGRRENFRQDDGRPSVRWVAERTAGLRDIVTTHPEIMHPVTRSIGRSRW